MYLNQYCLDCSVKSTACIIISPLISTWDDTAVGGDINDDFVILTEPNADLLNDSHCCSIGIDCSAHTGYSLQGVLLVSGVRSVESYVGDDVAYIGTNRGAFIKLTDDDRQR